MSRFFSRLRPYCLFLQHSFFIKSTLFLFRRLYAWQSKKRASFRACSKGSYVLFFLRHPTNICFRDCGLLLFSFLLSGSLSFFIRDALSPFVYLYHASMALVALALMGPLSSIQRKKVRRIFPIPSLFSFILGALIFGFFGGFIHPLLLGKIILLFAGILLVLHFL